MEDADDTNNTPETARVLTLTGGMASVTANACIPAGTSSSSSSSSSGGTASSDMGTSSSEGTASSSSGGAASSTMGGASSDMGGTSSSMGPPMCVADPGMVTGGSDAREVTPGDDWYRFTLPANTSVTVTLSIPTASDLDLYVYRAPGGEDAGSSTSTTNMETVAITGSDVATDFWVRVRPYGSTSNPGSAYTLALATVAGGGANDTCSGATRLTSGMTVNGDTSSMVNNHQFGGTGCTGYATVGKDAFYVVNVGTGQQLTATLRSQDDLSLYVLDACTGSCCWQGADADYSGTEEEPAVETLEFINETGAARDFWLVVDAFNNANAGPFTLEVTVDAP